MRNLNPAITFHLPEESREALKARLSKGQTMTDLMVMLVDRYLADEDQPSVQSLKDAMQKVIDNH